MRYGDLYTTFGLRITNPKAYVSAHAAAAYTPLPTKSIVFAASGESADDIGTSAVSLLAEPAVVGGDTVVFMPNGDVDPVYLTYALASAPLRASKAIRSTGFTVVHISAGRLKTLPVPLPGPSEQHAIADYLDRETAQIDTLIEEQRSLIDLLVQRRRAVQTSVLSDLIGQGARLKWAFTEIDRRAVDVVDSLPLMAVSISWGVRKRDDVTDAEPRAGDLSNYKVCAAGDLVVNRMRAFQGALGVAPEDGLVSPDYAVLRPVRGVDPEWLACAMRTSKFVAEMAARVKGIGSADLGNARTPRINVNDLGQIRVSIPELAVQRRIVAHLDEETAKIDTLIAETERFIELAKERRAALITAAVTGQIDVRQAS